MYCVCNIYSFIGLAKGLGEEIESQNDYVENIIHKAGNVDLHLGRQNEELKHILKK